MPKCKGEARSTGNPCKNNAITGRDFCRVHGGTVPAGVDHPNFKDGRYSKYMPKDVDILQKYEDFRSDPDIMVLDNEMALLHTRVAELIEELGGSNPSSALDELRGLRRRYLGYRDEANRAGVAQTMEDILDVIQAGGSDESTWDKITDAIEAIRRISGTDAQRRAKMEGMVPIENQIFLIATIAKLVLSNVSEETERLKISQGLKRLVSEGTIEVTRS